MPTLAGLFRDAKISLEIQEQAVAIIAALEYGPGEKTMAMISEMVPRRAVEIARMAAMIRDGEVFVKPLRG